MQIVCYFTFTAFYLKTFFCFNFAMLDFIFTLFNFYLCHEVVFTLISLDMKSFGQKPWMLPQLVLIIGTYNKEGKPNAMNAAWGGQWDAHEIMISLGSHATTDNMAINDEFTVAFATTETLVAADYVGMVSARNTPNKIEKTGWKIEKSPNVNAPLFKNFPMTMECRISKKIDESETGFYLVAEIVNILCDEKYVSSDGNPDLEKMNLITYNPINHTYVALGKAVGMAFSDGKKLK